MEIDYILLNAIVYVITLLIIMMRERHFSVYVLLWSIYAFTAVMGYVILKTDDWDYSNPNLGTTVSFLPYVMAYLSLHLISYPFKGYNEANINYTILKPNKVMDSLCGIMIVSYVFLGLVTGLTAYTVSSTIGFGEAYEMVNEGASEGTLLREVLGEGLFFWIYRICCWIVIPTPVFILYYLIKMHYEKNRWNRYLFYIFLSQIRPVAQALIGGSRGALFFLLFDLLFYFIVFRRIISPHFDVKNGLILISVGVLFVVVFISIISSRIENKQGYVTQDDTRHSMMSYMGQSYPNLGAYYYDNINHNINGRRFFPEFFTPDTESVYEKMKMTRTEYWNMKMGVPMEKFKTFWGDWYIEFGFLGSIAGLLLLYFFFKIICFNHKYRLFAIPILVFYFEKVCMFAFANGTGIAGSDAHKQFYISLLTSGILLLYEKHKKRLKFI